MFRKKIKNNFYIKKYFDLSFSQRHKHFDDKVLFYTVWGIVFHRVFFFERIFGDT